VLAAAKVLACFSGPMRTNLVAMLSRNKGRAAPDDDEHYEIFIAI